MNNPKDIFSVVNMETILAIVHILRNALWGRRTDLALRNVLNNWGFVRFCITRGVGGVQKELNKALRNINGERLNFGYSNQNWHVTGSCIGPFRVHNCNNLIYLSQ